MNKSYKDYCREAVEHYPRVYNGMFNKDGSRKRVPIMTSFCKKKVPNTPKKYLKNLQKDGWTSCSSEDSETKPQDLVITGTEIRLKGRIQNLTIKKYPPGCSKKEYKRIWMYNDRVRKKLKILKEQYGITKFL